MSIFLSGLLGYLKPYIVHDLVAEIVVVVFAIWYWRLWGQSDKVFSHFDPSISWKKGFLWWKVSMWWQKDSAPMFNIGVHKLRTQFFINFHANNSDENPCLVWKGFKTASGQVLLLTALVERSRFWPISGCSGRGRHISAWKQTLTQHRSSPSSECPAVFLLF